MTKHILNNVVIGLIALGFGALAIYSALKGLAGLPFLFGLASFFTSGLITYFRD